MDIMDPENSGGLVPRVDDELGKANIHTESDSVLDPSNSILCCVCGISIPPNQANMCASCISTEVDITEGIPKQVSVFYCKGCGRYLKPPWITAELESPELLAFCLKKIKGLNRRGVKLVDAAFIWTEPHSRRLKVKVTIRREALNSVILQQSFVVEFIIQTQQCEDCARLATEHVWKACVQVRQKVSHQRTFLFLEQLLIKHNLTSNIVKIVSMPSGLDFFYGSKSHAVQLLDFLESVVPVKSKQSKRLVSQDFSSNTVNYKYTIFGEIAPICRHDLVCLPKSVRKELGNIFPLLLVEKVSNVIQMVDPCNTSRRKFIEMESSIYFKYNFTSLCTQSHLSEWIILNVEPIDCESRGKYQMAEIEIARAADLGVNDTTFVVKSHLGNLLKPGDTAAGYDLTLQNLNDDEYEAVVNSESFNIPEVILVKKVYPNRKNRSKKRVFKLKELEKENEEGMVRKGDDNSALDKELFMQEIEEDVELQKLINLYKKHDVASGEVENKEEDLDEDDGLPDINIEDLLEDLSLKPI